jgi:hypothetical protein
VPDEPISPVTMDSPANLMWSSNDEEPGAASSQSDSSDFSDTVKCQERKTAHLRAKRANRKKLGQKSMSYKSKKQQANAIEAVRKSLRDEEHPKELQDCP